MNDEQAINVVLTLLNLAISRAQTDPVAAGKIQRGEPLDSEDFVRLGIDRDLAGARLQAAIDEAESEV